MALSNSIPSIFSTFPNFDLDEINLNDSGVKVFDFHPSHVYMNTRSLDEYENIKQNYHDMDYLNSVKNSEKPGIRCDQRAGCE